MQKGSAALVIALIAVLVAVVVWVSLEGGDTSIAGSTPESSEPEGQPSEAVGVPLPSPPPTRPEEQEASDDGAVEDDAIPLESGDTFDDLDSGLSACDFDDLPATSLNVIDDIEDGGPFDYPRDDGGTFGNYEGVLPSESNGYYREYTVETPGLSHRGARRIVTGGFDEDQPEEWFFTSDHYDSFCEFAPAP